MGETSALEARRDKTRAGLGSADGSQSFRIHDFRHNFASIVAVAGKSLPQIGALLGHKTAATTQRFADLTNTPQMEAVGQIEKAITAAGKKKPKADAEVTSLRKGKQKAAGHH